MFETMKIAYSAWKDSMTIANAARKGKRIETMADGTYVIIINS